MAACGALMRIGSLHSWDLDVKQAREIQERLSAQVIRTGEVGRVRYIAGADISTEKHSDLAYAGVVVLHFPSLAIVERKGITLRLRFPYIPGLLAFREGPPLLSVFEKLRLEPDLILFDGQGIAHPRGLGIASHMGLFLNKPSIGCAKSLLFGRFTDPALQSGSFGYLRDGEGVVIGAALRTRTGIRPVFASIGHRLDLYAVLEWILATCRGYRLPEPIRQAHRFVNQLRVARA